jgi:predicted Abi (CAAX) family protease
MSKINASTSSPLTVARSAISARPSLRDWTEAVLLFLPFLALASYVGLGNGLFKITLTDAWLEFAIIALIAVFIPALGEELVFRVALPTLFQKILPSAAGQLLALGLFIVWHPMQLSLGLPLGQTLFLDPGFLLIVAALGLICAISYRRSGSIWPAVMMHWLSVVLWKGLTMPL